MVYSPTPIPGPLGWGWGGRPPKRSRTLEKSRVLWCGKQDLNLQVRIAHMNLNHARLPIPPFPHGMKWAGVDSNHRSVSRQIYSLLPLATREPTHIMDFPLDPKGGAGDGTRTRNLLITNQLLCQLSYTSQSTDCCATSTAFANAPRASATKNIIHKSRRMSSVFPNFDF